jgi:hypothetical protein
MSLSGPGTTSLRDVSLTVTGRIPNEEKSPVAAHGESDGDHDDDESDSVQEVVQESQSGDSGDSSAGDDSEHDNPPSRSATPQKKRKMSQTLLRTVEGKPGGKLGFRVYKPQRKRIAFGVPFVTSDGFVLRASEVPGSEMESEQKEAIVENHNKAFDYHQPGVKLWVENALIEEMKDEVEKNHGLLWGQAAVRVHAKLLHPLISREAASEFINTHLMIRPDFVRLLNQLELWWLAVKHDLDEVRKFIAIARMNQHQPEVLQAGAPGPLAGCSSFLQSKFVPSQLNGQMKLLHSSYEKMKFAPLASSNSRFEKTLLEFGRRLEEEALEEWNVYECRLVDNIIDSAGNREICMVDELVTVTYNCSSGGCPNGPGEVRQASGPGAAAARDSEAVIALTFARVPALSPLCKWFIAKSVVHLQPGRAPVLHIAPEMPVLLMVPGVMEYFVKQAFYINVLPKIHQREKHKTHCRRHNQEQRQKKQAAAAAAAVENKKQ